MKFLWSLAIALLKILVVLRTGFFRRVGFYREVAIN